MDGFAILHWLKTNPRCSVLPVMVFSSSNSQADIEKPTDSARMLIWSSRRP